MFESSEDFTFCRIFQSRRLEVTAVVLTMWSEVCILSLYTKNFRWLSDSCLQPHSPLQEMHSCFVHLSGERTETQRGLSHSPNLPNLSGSHVPMHTWVRATLAEGKYT